MAIAIHPVHQRPAVPHRISREGVRAHQPANGVLHMERRADLDWYSGRRQAAPMSRSTTCSTPAPGRNWPVSGPRARCSRCAASIASAAIISRTSARWARPTSAIRRSSSRSRRDSIVEDGGAVALSDVDEVDCQYEVELVVAIGKAGDDHSAARSARSCLRLCRRRRNDAPRPADALPRRQGWPWENGKSFDHSAPCSAIVPASASGIDEGALTLTVNGKERSPDRRAHDLERAGDHRATLRACTGLRPAT